MKIGFCAWNMFQVRHYAEIIRHCDGAELIIYYTKKKRDESIAHDEIHSLGVPVRYYNSRSALVDLDHEFDALVFQNSIPAMALFQHARVVMLQYSMAKAKIAFNLRWYMADLGLVYGRYSAEMIGPMCPAAEIGNPQFDPLFENRLDREKLTRISSKLDPDKKTLLYVPTWGDLNSLSMFGDAISQLSSEFNVIFKPHHMSDIRNEALQGCVIDDNMRFGTSDSTVYLMSISDLVVSDFSGAIFDGLYAQRPVVLLQDNAAVESYHRKFSRLGLEFAARDRIGPVVTDPKQLRKVIEAVAEGEIDYSSDNEELVSKCFARRGGAGRAAAEAIKSAATRPTDRTLHQLIMRDNVAIVSGWVNSKGELKADSEPSRKRRRRRRLRRRIRKFAGRTARRVLGTGRAYQCVRDAGLFCWRLYRRGHISFALRIARVIQKQEFGKSRSCRLLQRLHQRYPNSTDVAVALAEVYKDQPDPVKAMSLYEKIEKNQAMPSRKMLKLLMEYDRHVEVSQALERFVSMPPAKRVKSLYVYHRAVHKTAYSQQKWAEVRNKTCDVAAEMARSNPAAFGRATECLRRAGLVDEWKSIVESAPDTPEVEEAKADLRQKEELLGAVWPMVQAAGENENKSPEHRVVLQGNHVTDLKSVDGSNPVVELFIPDSFVGNRLLETTPGRRARIAVVVFYRSLQMALQRMRIPVIPRLQPSSVAALGSPQYITLSHHTIGGHPNQYHIKLSSLIDYFTMDPHGYAGWASLAAEDLTDKTSDIAMSDADQTWRTLYEQFVLGQETKFAQKDSAVQFDGEYVLCILQVVDDAVAKHAHMSSIELLRAMASTFAGTGIKVIAKRHPLCTSWAVDEELRSLSRKRKILVSDGPIHKLIEGAKAVFTVNSGAGFESLIHLKKVILSGKSDYMWACDVVKTSDELVELIRRPDWWKADQERIKKFLHYYVNSYLIHNEDVDRIESRLCEMLDRKRKKMTHEIATFPAEELAKVSGHSVAGAPQR